MFKKRKTESERKRERIETELLIQQVRAVSQIERQERETFPDGFSCERHPHWQPTRRSRGVHQPKGLAANCPYCLQKHDEERATPREHIDVPHPAFNDLRFAHQQHLVADARERWERQLEEAGQPVPGTEDERLALERIDQRRAEHVRLLRQTAEQRRRNAERYWSKQPRHRLLGT